MGATHFLMKTLSRLVMAGVDNRTLYNQARSVEACRLLQKIPFGATSRRYSLRCRSHRYDPAIQPISQLAEEIGALGAVTMR
jgi:hypothetical protein